VRIGAMPRQSAGPGLFTASPALRLPSRFGLSVAIPIAKLRIFASTGVQHKDPRSKKSGYAVSLSQISVYKSMIFLEAILEFIFVSLIINCGLRVRWFFQTALLKLSGKPALPYNVFQKKLSRSRDSYSSISNGILNYLLGLTLLFCVFEAIAFLVV
jgi:hypothetical protein